jgi:hypothetical protein
MSHSRRERKPLLEGEKGYSWLFFYARRSWILGFIVTLLVIGVSGSFYLWYSRYGDDPTPNGTVGLSYALAGFTFLVLAAAAYSLRRRFPKHAPGQLNTALNWHVFFALMGVTLLLMHAFGNFNPHSGTYALASMIALTVSGLLGRTLDRFLAWRIAVEVHQALTAGGEDRVEAIVQEVRTIVVHKTHQAQSFMLRSPELQHPPASAVRMKETGPLLEQWPHLSLDLTYTSREKIPQQWSRQGQQHRLLPNEERLYPPHWAGGDGQEQLAALKVVQQAMWREGFYRSVIQYWRVLHLALALLTLGLTLWHLVYALQFLLSK